MGHVAYTIKLIKVFDFYHFNYKKLYQHSFDSKNQSHDYALTYYITKAF